MNMQTLDARVFLHSLTEEQQAACVRDEAERGRILDEGLSEPNAVRFHRAMLSVRRVIPDTTVGGALELALSVGLSFLGDEDVLARFVQAREDDVIVYGVQRRDGKDVGRTSGIVSPDVAAPVKAKRKRKLGLR